MRITLYLQVLMLCYVSVKTLAQSSALEYVITVNGNLYVPINSPDKGMFPILWYDKETDPKLLIGGSGIGISIFKPYKDRFKLKAQANLSRHTYWDEPVIVNAGPDPWQVVGPFQSSSSDVSLGLAGTVPYFITENFSVGTGLGVQVLLTSYTRQPETMQGDRRLVANNYFKRFMPVVPVEVSYSFKKMMLNIRYEHGLLNRLKKDLAKYKTDKFGLLSFEIGRRINRDRVNDR